ncbi:MAG: hypothetical protein GX224_03590 [Thermoplasmatales archaeon]|nr:hypothetical protein [Thermoplasmatales archaeon]
MKRNTQLKETDSVVLTPDNSKQAETMMGLVGEGSGLKLTRTPAGDAFSAEGCIGHFVFRDGSTMDVTPLIPSVKTDDGSSRMLMEMLYPIFGMDTHGRSEENLFEFFVRVFTDTVSRLVARGMRSKYHLVSGNEKAFKGRIVFNEHIRQNYIHKERIYVEYENFSQNRPENRLIKATLEVLLRNTANDRNIKNIKALLLGMEDIPSSVNVDRDFEMCVMDRNMIDYVSPMLWCNVFLKGMGLGGASVGALSYALLVSTDEVFGAYVARMSSSSRADGMYQIRYDAEVLNEGGAGGVSVIIIKLKWSFYDRRRDQSVTDAELLYMTAPGYRVIPDAGGGDRLRGMAGSYLSDVLV